VSQAWRALAGQWLAMRAQGEDGEFGSFAGLDGLGAGDGEDQAVGLFGDLGDGEGGVSERRRAATKPTRGSARSRRPARSGSGGRLPVFHVSAWRRASSLAPVDSFPGSCGQYP
jgi:hypothetical protein